MKSLSDDASLPLTKPELEAEIATIDRELEETDAALRTLLAAEDTTTGVFYAQDIHSLRQQKLMLMTRKDLRKVRIRRLQYTESE